MGFFFVLFSILNRGENSIPFSSTKSIYNSPRRQSEYRFFCCCPSGNLQVDVVHCEFEHSLKLYCTPVTEPCRGEPVQWHWGQFKETRFSIMWNLTFLVLLDMSSKNDFIFTLFKILTYFFFHAHWSHSFPQTFTLRTEVLNVFSLIVISSQRQFEIPAAFLKLGDFLCYLLVSSTAHCSFPQSCA